jgi:hypothetical protein
LAPFSLDTAAQGQNRWNSITMHLTETEPYTASPPRQPSIESQESFRFLDLPKDIRLIVYDLLPTVTRHYTLSTNNDHYSLAIVTQHETCLSLLQTCRAINYEAVAMRRRLEKLRNEPLRIIVHWRSVGDSPLQGVLQCAALEYTKCNGSFKLDLLFPERVDKVPRYKTGAPPRFVGPPGWLDAQHSQSREGLDINLPFTSHRDLHAILHRQWPSETTRKIEVAIDCTGITKQDVNELRYHFSEIYIWFLRMQHVGSPGGASVALRLMPMTNDVAAMLEGWRSKDYVEETWACYGREHGWSVEIGDWVYREEWYESWDKGEGP